MKKRKFVIISPDVFSYGAMLVGGISRDEGYQIKLSKDFRVENAKNVDFVGLSLVSIQHLLRAREFVSKVKSREGPLVLVGGSITQEPELVFEILPGTDFVVVGECEETLPRLMETIEEEGEIEDVKGIAFRQDDEVVRTEPSEPANLEDRPLPEIPQGIEKQNVRGANVYLETHRGCWGNCSFCQVPTLFGRKVRSRPIKELVEEVKAFRKVGAERIAIFGGTSTQYGCKGFELNEGKFVKSLKKISEVTGKNNLSVPDLRVDMITEDMLEALKEYTIGFVIFGIESGSDRMLQRMRKGITVDKVKEGVNRARRVGIEVGGAFIVGYPGENDEDYAKTRDLVEELMLDDYTISLADPIPGTKLAEEAVQLPRKENSLFVKDSTKLGSRHELTVAETRAFDLWLTASAARSRPLPFTDELYDAFLDDVKKQGEEIRLSTNVLKDFHSVGSEN